MNILLFGVVWGITMFVLWCTPDELIDEIEKRKLYPLMWMILGVVLILISVTM